MKLHFVDVEEGGLREVAVQHGSIELGRIFLRDEGWVWQQTFAFMLQGQLEETLGKLTAMNAEREAFEASIIADYEKENS